MATETLRPNAAGDKTELTPSAGNNYACVNEESADEDTSYVYITGSNNGIDLYNLPASSGNGTINSVTVYHRARRVGADGGTFNTVRAKIETYDTEYAGDSTGLTEEYVTSSHTWDTNPDTENAWEWTEIDALQAGMWLAGAAPGAECRCTQVYIVVDYEAPPSIGNMFMMFNT